MNTFNQRIDDGNEFTARIRLQDRTVVADASDHSGSFIRSDEVILDQLKLIHCLVLELRHCAMIGRRRRDMR